ncbi:hypothetical protein BDR22DRAFT_848102 [Usnea florida]
MNTNALVAAFKLSISLAAPVMTMVVGAVRAVQAIVHENHRKSVINYLIEALCGSCIFLFVRSPWHCRRYLRFGMLFVHEVAVDPKARRTSSFFSIAWQRLIHCPMQVAMLGWSSSSMKYLKSGSPFSARCITVKREVM